MDWAAEVARLSRLARLELAPEEARRLAEECAAIAHDFSTLQSRAATLPAPDEPAPGALREDVAAPLDAREADGILAAAPSVDARSRAVLARRRP